MCVLSTSNPPMSANGPAKLDLGSPVDCYGAEE